MDRPTVQTKLQEIIRNLFDQPALVIRDDMNAKDVNGWDSITHIDLICSVEDEFKIRLSTKEVADLGNVGELMDLIQKKTS
jgi:acyl carrier protein